MALILSDRVKETSVTSGLGSVVLSGPLGGFQSFASAIGDGNNTYYAIENESQWEVGVGTYSSGSNSLSRDTILASSNSNNKINLNGVSTVFCTYAAGRSVYLNNQDLVDLRNHSGILLDRSSLLSTGTLLHEVRISGQSILQPDSDAKTPLTIIRGSAGNFFHAYIDDALDRTIGLYTDGQSSPTWRLGLKNNPNSVYATPDYGYVYGKDGTAGLAPNSINKLELTNTAGLSYTHNNTEVLRATSTTGVHLNSLANAYPALSLNGGPVMTANIQEWKTYAGTVLSAVDSQGRFAINRTSASYQVDVAGSGRFNAIVFNDGTIQSTSAQTGYINLIGTSGVSTIGSPVTSGTITVLLTDTAVDSGVYGNSANIASFTVDKKGRLIAASNIPISYASGVHTHSASDITDFDIAVSGLVSGIYQPLLTNPVTGTGINGYVARWINSNTIASGIIYDDGTNIGIGTASPTPNGFFALGKTIHINQTSSPQYPNIRFTTTANDTSIGIDNTFSYLTTNKGWRFFTGSGGLSEVMRLEYNTNVGIGSTAAVAKLHVQNSSPTTTGVIVRGAAAQSADLQQWQNSAGTALVRVDSAGSISGVASGIFMGRLGVGTSDPAYKVDILTSGSNDGLRARTVNNLGFALLRNSNSDSFPIGALILNYGNDPSAYIEARNNSLFLRGGWTNDGYITFNPTTIGSTTAETMRVNKTGVGIFTTSPTQALDINGSLITNASIYVSGNNRIAQIYNDGNLKIDAAGGYTRILTNFMVDGNIYSNDGDIYGLNASTNSLRFFAYDSSTHGSIRFFSNNSVERVRIDSNGNFGIGTTSPTQALDVRGSAFISGALYDSNNSAGTNGQVLTSTATGTDWKSLSEITGVDGVGTSGYAARWTDTDTIGTGIIYDNGTNIGIGTTSPTQKLDVRGTAYVSGNLGIGTTNPQAFLHISGDAPTVGTFLRFQNNLSTGKTFFDIRLGTPGVYDDHIFFNRNGTNFFGATSTSDLYLPAHAKIEAGKQFMSYNNGNCFMELQSTAGSSPVGSTDATRIGYLSTGSFRILSSYNEVLRINGSGDVGIGTPSPVQKLDVRGTVYVSGSLGVGTSSPSTRFQTGELAGHYVTEANADAGVIVGYGTGVRIQLSRNAYSSYGASYAATYGDAGLKIGNGASYGYITGGTSGNLCINAGTGAGRVGIGTLSPSAKLDILGTLNVSSGDFGEAITFHNGYKIKTFGGGGLEILGSPYVRIGSVAGVNVAHFTTNTSVAAGLNITPIAAQVGLVVTGASAQSADLQQWRDNSSTTLLRVDSAGSISGVASGIFMQRVGIGTSSPTQSLDVNGSAYVGGSTYVTGWYYGRRFGTYGWINGDTYIQTYAGNSTLFNVDTTEIARITASGLGIGTSAPSAKLQVNGISAAAIFDTASANDGRIEFKYNGSRVGTLGYNSGITSLISDVSCSLDLGAGNLTRMSITAGGNVGIGTTSPQYRLDVRGNAWISGTVHVGGPNIGTTLGAGSTYEGYIGGHNGLIFSTNQLNVGLAAGEKMRLTAAGLFGVGTNSPSAQLHINASSATTTGVIVRGAASQTADLQQWQDSAGATLVRIDSAGSISGVASGIFMRQVGVGVSSPIAALHVQQGSSAQAISNIQGLLVENNGNAAGTYALQVATAAGKIFSVTNAGNVGIGTTSPAELLTVYGDNKNIQLKSAATTGSNAIIFADTADRFEIYKPSSSSDLRFKSRNGGVGDVMTLKYSNAYVGIGTTNPQYLLDVSGTIRGNHVTAITKSFLIDHPTRPGKSLRYASLEGPENGVYLRGSGSGNYIILPDYWCELVNSESITVNLTPVGSYQQLWVKSKNVHYIEIVGAEGAYDYAVWAERKDVPKLEVEI